MNAIEVYCDPASVWWTSPARSPAPSAAPGPHGLLERVQDQRGPHRPGGAPAQDPPGVGVDDERDVDHARPGRDVGEVGDPEPVRGGRAELPPHQVSGPGRGRGGHRGADPLPAARPGQAQLAHQPLHRAPGHRRALAVELQPDLPRPVDAVVLRVHPADLGLQLLIAHGPGRGHPAGGVVVGGRGDRAAVLGQHAADRLDPEPGLVLADEPHETAAGGRAPPRRKPTPP